MIELDRIGPDPDQPRRDLATDAQKELTDSIKRVGILQPITVRYVEKEAVYRVISGERRFQAAKTAGLTEIPCWVQSPREKDILLHQITENWQRAELHPYELADALGHLKETNGYTQKQIADLTGKPESEISRLLSLLRIVPEVQTKARTDQRGTFTKRHLVALAQLPAEKQPALAASVEARNLTAEETERLVQDGRDETKAVKQRGAPRSRRFTYVTTKAHVTVTFRRKNVPRDDILDALDEARDLVMQDEDSAGDGN